VTRRRFIFDIAALVAWITPLGFPRHATGQQPTSLKHIGVLFAGSWTEEMIQAFRQGLTIGS